MQKKNTKKINNNKNNKEFKLCTIHQSRKRI